jgi:phage shock protein C
VNERHDLWNETWRVLKLWGDELGRLFSGRRDMTGNAVGAPGRDIPPRRGERRLYRSRRDRMVRGVCAGLADYFGLPVSLVRAAFVLLSLPGVIHGIVLYVLLAFLIPDAPREEAYL